MKTQWKKLVTLVMVFMAAISMTGCAVLYTLLEEDQPSGQQTTASSTQTLTQSRTNPVTKPVTKAGQTTKPESITTAQTQVTDPNVNQDLASIQVDEDGSYNTKMEVAAYLYQYGHLPDNYLTKNDARNLGWVAERTNLWKVTDKMSIGGDKFGNYEGLLPKKKGRQYYEADIDYRGGGRNAKRIVYSNDGLIFYTDDHYESFEQLN